MQIGILPWLPEDVPLIDRFFRQSVCSRILHLAASVGFGFYADEETSDNLAKAWGYGDCVMPCVSCQSTNQAIFPAEANIHFPGFEGLERATLWVFPSFLICLDCELTQFTMSRTDLQRLREPGRDAQGESAGAD